MNRIYNIDSTQYNPYRFAFNSQEKTDEIAGEGNHNTALFWEYDTRTGRRWNLDPKPTVGISDYACFGGNPILFSDILGDSIGVPKNIFNTAMAGIEGYNEEGLNLKEWETFSNGIKDVTGISLNTPQLSDNVLTISSIDDNIGSKTARSVFSKALTDKDVINTELVYSDPKVDGAIWFGKMNETFNGNKLGWNFQKSVLKIDMDDINNLTYSNVDKRAFGLGLIFGHELVHRYYGDENMAVGTMNTACKEMGLSQRISYGPHLNDWLPSPKIYIIRFGDILENGNTITTGGVFMPTNK